ncbi:MAG TPA: helix-turn-helix domain-containing protein [Nitrososphaera sp.]|nr:helix-turn-helix domain-containing protein [Nitrososphaera sp.]
MGRYSDESVVEHPHFMKEKLAEYENEIITQLSKLDLSPNEAKILLYLMIYNSSTASEIAKLSGVARTDSYYYLSSLLAKGVLRTTFDRPQRYQALSYKESVEHLIKVKTANLGAVSEKKEYYHGLISQILDNVVQHKETDKDVYQVVVGKEPLVAKIHSLIQTAKKEITLLLSEEEVMILYRNNLVDELHKSVSRGVKVNIKTPSTNISNYIKSEDNTAQKISLEVINNSSPVGCIIFDGEEMITFIESNTKGFRDSGIRVFYTNNRKLISAFKVTTEKS